MTSWLIVIVFASLEIESSCFVHTRQALYHLSYVPTLLEIGDRVSLLLIFFIPQTGLKIFLPPPSKDLGLQGAPPYPALSCFYVFVAEL
jgi:hypothetical protein